MRLILAFSVASLVSLHVPALGGQQPVPTSNLGCTFAGVATSIARRGTQGGPYFTFTFDSVGAITPDGRGAYVHLSDGVLSFAQNSGVRLYPHGATETFEPAEPTAQSRRLRIDLSQPLESGYANLGLQDVGLITVHWTQDSERRIISGLLDLPVGVRATSERLEIHVRPNNRWHILRIGNLDTSLCWSEAAIYGQGTTPALIHRLSDDTWVVEIAPGGAARLWELLGEYPNMASLRFENRGLYAVAWRMTIKLKDGP